MLLRSFLLFHLLYCFIGSCIIYSADISLTNFKNDWVKIYKTLIAKTGSNVFVESGTYLGDTAKKAAQCFEEVHTVELNEHFYNQATSTLKEYSNVIVYHGDTIDLFPKILYDLNQRNKKAVFWLDGHFMTSMVEDNIVDHPEGAYTPIMKELSIICSLCNDPILLIDDIRLFGTKLFGNRLEHAGNQEYPLLADIFIFLQQKHHFECFIVGDILIAFKSKSLSISDLIKACTISRLYDGTNYPVKKILAAELALAQADGIERKGIIELYKEYAMPWREWHNKSPHYSLWYGLLLQKENKHHEAVEQFHEVLRLGMNHWRIYWYLSVSYFALGQIYNAQTALKKSISV